MPTIEAQSNAKVLVSGANGFVAMQVIQELLQQGYTVRGTVRTPSKGDHILNFFKPYVAANRLELVVVDDIARDGAFDDAVKGVDAIMHVATPLSIQDDEPESFFKPAVGGTLGVLKSALKNGASVKRIVITSSCAAIRGLPQTFTVYNEDDWADIFVDIVKEKGREADSMAKYRASKVLAERAAWDFYRTNQASVGWDMVVLHPPFIYGPPIQECSSIQSLNMSSAMLWDKVLNAQTDEILQGNQPVIDLRDLGVAHVRALQKADAAGQRILVIADDLTYQETLDLLHSITPSPPWISKIQKGKPGIARNPAISFDGSKGIRILDMKYRPFQDTLKDTFDDFHRRGWLD